MVIRNNSVEQINVALLGLENRVEELQAQIKELKKEIEKIKK